MGRLLNFMLCGLIWVFGVLDAIVPFRIDAIKWLAINHLIYISSERFLGSIQTNATKIACSASHESKSPSEDKALLLIGSSASTSLCLTSEDISCG